jgi:mono/diheme cytochrome c family protein
MSAWRRTIGGTVVGAVMAIASCGSALPEPRLEDTPNSDKPGAESLIELQRGRALTIANCAGCHALKLPHSMPPEAWASEVRSMRRERGLRLTDSEADAIAAYMRAMASRPD